MKIELKNIRHYKQMSKETNACYADVYVDGVRVGFVQNCGHGDDMLPNIADRALFEKMLAWAKAQPAVKTEFGDLDMNLDLYMATLVNDDLLRKDAARFFKSRLCFTNDAGELLTTETMPAEEIAKHLSGEKTLNMHPGQRLLKSVEEVFEVMAKG